MFVSHFRIGFATNSSSTHSIIIPSKDMIENMEGGSFGWNDFVLTSADAKKIYFARQLAYAFERSGLSSELSNKYALLWTGAQNIASNIDHQSIWGMPSPVDEKGSKIWERVFAEILSNDVAIVGGNDNEDSAFENFQKHPLQFTYNNYGESDVDYLSRFDRDALILFNPKNGAKVRLTKSSYEKSSMPELVDVSLGDYCPYGCKFCYRSSVKKGQNAPKEDVFQIIDLLKEAGVFEIAFGGGEPLMHDDIIEILKYTRDAGIIPNITTFGTHWLNSEIEEAVFEYCSGVGVSIHNVSDISKLKKINERVNNLDWDDRIEVKAQHVFGSKDIDETIAILKGINKQYTGILLLGFKDFGFGTSFDKFDLSSHYDRLVEVIKELRVSVSVDTQMVETHPELVNRLAEDSVLVEKHEGKFSCFIDARKKTIAASSYTAHDEALEQNISEFQKQWMKF